MHSTISTSSSHAHEQRGAAERLEEDASLAGVAAAGGLRAIEVAIVVFIGLLVSPPLAVAAFIVVAPLFVAALVVGLLAAAFYVPYVLVHYFRGHGRGPHLPLLVHRLRLAGRALLDLAPHRIAAGVRNAGPGQTSR